MGSANKILYWFRISPEFCSYSFYTFDSETPWTYTEMSERQDPTNGTLPCFNSDVRLLSAYFTQNLVGFASLCVALYFIWAYHTDSIKKRPTSAAHTLYIMIWNIAIDYVISLAYILVLLTGDGYSNFAMSNPCLPFWYLFSYNLLKAWLSL